MRKNIQGINIELTNSIQDYVYKKLESLEKKIDPLDESAFADIMLSKTAGRHNLPDLYSVEINLHVSKKYLGVCTTGETIYASIDKMKDEIEREYGDYKNKKESIVKRSGAKIKRMLQGIIGR